ncbi:BTB/POZ protein [Fusarium flagelliforme]|nr:BTB/POZ protein [Fusarium flagelliforme]KAH7174776.1 BTB/POZ protein [Fusarium flagelliforme]
MGGIEIILGFHESFQSLYNNEDFSDLTVKCQDTQIKVHKVILACHSDHFKKMFTGEWKERTEKVIEIKDFEPLVVEAMLRFMYSFNYVGSQQKDSLFHAKVGEIADYYMVDTLKNMAAENFRSTAGWIASREELVALIEYMYKSPDLGLCDPILDRVTEKIDFLLEQDWFHDVMVSVPEFAATLVRRVHKRNPMVYRCYNCDVAMPWSSMGNNPTNCYQCNAMVRWGDADGRLHSNTL